MPETQRALGRRVGGICPVPPFLPSRPLGRCGSFLGRAVETRRMRACVVLVSRPDGATRCGIHQRSRCGGRVPQEGGRCWLAGQLVGRGGGSLAQRRGPGLA